MHVANHRKWFTTLTKIKSRIDNTGCDCSGDEPFTHEVRGIGDVELDVVVQENRTGPKTQKKLILRNVLYIPNIICNVLGEPILKSHKREKGTSKQKSWLCDKKTGTKAIVLDHPVLPRLRLVGMTATETSLKKKLCPLKMQWSDKERAKWLATQTPALPELTPKEKAWMKRHYKTEWKFLVLHGLKIDAPEQRAEGREILKQLVAEDSKKCEESEDSSDVKYYHRILGTAADPWSDLDSDDDHWAHSADWHFHCIELDWIEKEYGNSGRFIRKMCLRPWSRRDVLKAVEFAESKRGQYWPPKSKSTHTGNRAEIGASLR